MQGLEGITLTNLLGTGDSSVHRKTYVPKTESEMDTGSEGKGGNLKEKLKSMDAGRGVGSPQRLHY